MDALESGYCGRIGKYVDETTKLLENIFNRPVLLVANGTIALELALRSVGIKSDDYVIVPNVSFVAIANAVLSLNANVFC
ncbi:MAG: DegT/DnrJ/EryC1/StrS family aminotransferase [Saprospiraceae bacterium]|nr:DegT/DnrJ/EryC1/StrS family aminotransferase [Saprospiraceae bacterium]